MHVGPARAAGTLVFCEVEESTAGVANSDSPARPWIIPPSEKPDTPSVTALHAGLTPAEYDGVFFVAD